jgi:enamine deaminase RidA (YjgF/YER057c/UK114 family)
MSSLKISSESPFEDIIGFSRAVRVGNIIAISGTAPVQPNGLTASKGDVYGQTKYCFQIIEKTLQRAEATLKDIVRTRIMLVNISTWKEAAQAHGEIFKDIKPACTFVEISRFINEEWLVEVEADAIII